MYKSKLGISVGLFGCIICILAYFIGFSSWPFIAVIAYVLLREDNEWLKKLAIKAFFISLFFALIPVAINGIGAFFDILNKLFDTDKVKWYLHIDFYINKIAFIAEIVVFTIMSINSLSQKHTSMKKLDSVINNNI